MEIEFYLIIPDQLINDGATLLDCRVYGNITRQKRGCYASYATLAKWCNCERRSVITSIKRLVTMGWIVKQGKYFVPVRGGVSAVTTASDEATSDQPITSASDPSITTASDQPITHISNKVISKKNIRNIYTPTPPTISRPKTSLFNKKTSLSKEQYLSVLNDARLADGDREYLLHMVEEMEDWSQAGGKKKACWLATLRNWVRRSRKDGLLPHGKGNKTLNGKQGVKSFAQIDAEWQEKEDLKFKQLMRKAEEEGYDFIRE